MKRYLLLALLPVLVGITTALILALTNRPKVVPIIPTPTPAPIIVASAETPAPTPEPTPEVVEYKPDRKDVEYIAKTLWGEARGIESDMMKAAVAWCILNRVDNHRWGDTVEEVVTQPNQFHGYAEHYPVTEELAALAEDVLIRWHNEKITGEIDGRVLPSDYYFFHGYDNNPLYFRKEYEDRTYWKWTMENPYED